MEKMVQTIYLHKKVLAGMLVIFEFNLGCSLAPTAQVGLRVTASAIALVFTAHTELWKPSYTLLLEIKDIAAARRLKWSDTEMCSLIWRRVAFGDVPASGSTGSRALRGFPTEGHGLAIRSLGASASVLKSHFKAYARLCMSHELNCLLKVM